MWPAATTGPDGSRRRGRPRPACPVRRARPVAGGDVMDRVRGCARRAGRVRGHPNASLELLNVSENATSSSVIPGPGPRYCAYTGSATTPSWNRVELAWMEALRAEAGVRTPRVLPAADGQRVVTVSERGGGARTVLRALRVPPRRPTRLGTSRGGRTDAQPFRRAWQDYRADAPARAGMVPPGLVHPVPGLRGGLRSTARWGRWTTASASGHQNARSSAGWTTCSRLG